MWKNIAVIATYVCIRLDNIQRFTDCKSAVKFMQIQILWQFTTQWAELFHRWVVRLFNKFFCCSVVCSVTWTLTYIAPFNIMEQQKDERRHRVHNVQKSIMFNYRWLCSWKETTTKKRMMMMTSIVLSLSLTQNLIGFLQHVCLVSRIMKYFSKLNFDPSSWLLSPFFTELWKIFIIRNIILRRRFK